MTTSQKRIDAMVWLLSKVSKKQTTSPMPEFEQLTGRNHTSWMENWQANLEGKARFESSCNAFVIQYCHGINFPNKFASFYPSIIKDLLVKAGKPDAWVSCHEGMPDSGDICIWAGRQHMGICTQAMWVLDGDHKDGEWYSIEGGQTHRVVKELLNDEGKVVQTIDRDKSFDSIKWKKYPNFPASELQGWINIDKYFYYPTGNPNFKKEIEARNRQWISKDGKVVHPGAPEGSEGEGHFCNNGILPEDPFNRGRLPHPRSPEGRLVDPLKISQLKKDYEMS